MKKVEEKIEKFLQLKKFDAVALTDFKYVRVCPKEYFIKYMSFLVEEERNRTIDEVLGMLSKKEWDYEETYGEEDSRGNYESKLVILSEATESIKKLKETNGK